MVHSRFSTAIGAALVVILVTIAPVSAVDTPEDSALRILQEPLNPDLNLIAEGNDWTVAEAAAQQHAAAVVGIIATRIAEERPEIYIGSALSEVPGGTPTLYVKGPADAFVLDLVGASDIDIILADMQPYSLEELEARSGRVHLSLAAAGFQNIVTGANITGGGLIPASVALEPGLPTETSSILARIPSDLRGSVVLSVGDASGFRDTGAWGAMYAMDGAGEECTTGWTVQGSDSGGPIFGVTTAGHCNGIDGIKHGTPIHSFSKVKQHRGEYGDIEWGTTDATELAQFWAEAGVLRYTLYLEPRSGISINESACQYGRFSDDRDCSLHVDDTSIACTLDGVYNNRLVQMSAITSTFGDSGGGWSSGYKAYGSQKGWCNNKGAWSVADLYDEALGVQVVIYE